MTEDGGATVNFDPSAATPEGGEDHDANLADFLDDKVLDPNFNMDDESPLRFAMAFDERMNKLAL